VVILTVPDALNTAFFDFLKHHIVFYVSEMDMSMVVGIQMDNKRCHRLGTTGKCHCSDAILLERLDSFWSDLY
jgi:hypothetical protein